MAALDLLSRADYETVQMREVAKHAEVALGTLYRYFPSKERLFGQVLMRWCEDFWRGLESGSRPRSNRERLTEVALRTVAAYEREPQFLVLLFLLDQSNDPAVSECLEYIGGGGRRVFRKTLEGVDDADAETIVDVVLVVLWMLLMRWVRGRRTIDEVRSKVTRSVTLLLEFQDTPVPADAGVARSGVEH